MNLFSSFEENLYSFIETFVFAVNNHADSKNMSSSSFAQKLTKKFLNAKSDFDAIEKTSYVN